MSYFDNQDDWLYENEVFKPGVRKNTEEIIFRQEWCDEQARLDPEFQFRRETGKTTHRITLGVSPDQPFTIHVEHRGGWYFYFKREQDYLRFTKVWG